MKDKSFDLRVYAEGVHIPAYSITRTQEVGKPLEFTVDLPPTPSAFRVLPDTVMHAFVQRNGEDWELFAEGRAKNRAIQSAKSGRLATRIRCEGIDGDWNETHMGFDVGQNRGFPSVKESHFFYGLSSGEDAELIPGFDRAEGAKVLTSSGSAGAYFMSFNFALRKFMNEEGPVQAIVSILGSMGRISPLFRRDYNAMGTQTRVGYIENKRITEFLKKSSTTKLIQNRFKALPANATLMDVVRIVLRDSFHEMVTLPSAPFDPPKSQEKEEPEETTEEDAPPKIGSGDPVNTSTDASLSELYNDPRIQAYLDNIAASEFHGAGISKDKKYRALFGAGQIPGRFFQVEGEWKHPNRAFTVDGRTASPAGRYQIVNDTWQGLKSGGYGLYLPNFSPKSQDYAAIVLLKQCGAVGPILKGNMVEANAKASTKWASIPNIDGGRTLRGDGTPPRGHDEIAAFQTQQIQERLSDGGTVPTPNADGKTVSQVKQTPETLPTHVIKPTIRESPPPRCNVLFDNQVEGINVQEQFTGAPTRFMMRRELGVASEAKKGSPASKELAANREYAPRKLAYLMSQLNESGQMPDLMTNSEQEKLSEAISEAEPDQSSKDADEEIAKRVENKRAASKSTEEASKNDLLSAIQNGDSPLPNTMLSLYTMEELLRGVQPKIGKFPFPKLGEDTSVPEIEADINEAIESNEEILADLTPLTDEVVKKGIELRKNSTDKHKEATVSMTAKSVWANYQYAMARKSMRRISVTSPLNMDLALGYPAAVHHPALGWATGTVERVTDRISVREETATTEISMSHCTFHTDRQNPVREHIEMAAEADANKMNEAGYPRNPIFFEDRFSDQQIGQEIYKQILEVGSIIDWAKEIASSEKEGEESDISTEKDALDKLYESYKEARDPRAWVEQKTKRPIAVEKEFFERVLGAEKDGEDWSAPYRIFEMATQEDAFMKERADWARNYREELRSEGNSIDATFAERDT